MLADHGADLRLTYLVHLFALFNVKFIHLLDATIDGDLECIAVASVEFVEVVTGNILFIILSGCC